MIGRVFVNKQKNYMKICVLIDAWSPVWGGGQTHVWEICKLLADKYNYNIDIYTRSLITKQNYYSDKNVLAYKDKIKVFTVGSKAQFNYFPARIFWIFQVIQAVMQHHQRSPYSLLHAHAYLGGIPGKILSILLKIPIVFTVHGSNYMDTSTWSINAMIEKLLLTRIKYDQEVSVSHHFLKYPNINKNILVVPNGVDITKFDQITKTKKLSHKTILWVGRFDWTKGLDCLIRAFYKVKKNIFRVKLILVGIGSEENKIKKLVQVLRLTDDVLFLGSKNFSQLVTIYKSVDLFVLPSLTEGQPITLLEAMAAKLPVITSDVGDNPLIIEQGFNGYMFKANDVDMLAGLIMTCLNNKSIKKLGLHGYNLVRKKYSWELSASKYHQLYQKLLKRIY